MARTTERIRFSLGFQALFAAITAALMLVIGAIPANAAPRDSSRIVTTKVWFFAETANAHVSLYKDSYSGGYELCVTQYSTGTSGCSYVPTENVTVGRGMLTVAPTTVQLYTENCGPEGCEPPIPAAEVTVAITFNATGSPARSSNSYRSRNGCHYSYRSRGVEYPGQATITIDGVSQTSRYALLSTTTRTITMRGENCPIFF